MTEKEMFAAVQNGSPFFIDLFYKSCMVGRTKIFENGKCFLEGETTGLLDENDRLSDTYQTFLGLYYQYMFTIKGHRNGSKEWFRALSAVELTEDDLMFAQSRRDAQFNLEYFFLKSVCDRSLTWSHFDEKGTKWFWKDKSVIDNRKSHLCVFRDWVDINKQ